MTEQQQREACAELARQVKANAGLAQAMGYQLRLTMDNLPDAHVIAPDGKRLSLSELPDYFTDPVASRELMAWLLADMRATKNMNPIYKFCEILVGGVLGEDRLEVCDWEECVIAAMTADLPVIARAACQALGIEVSE